MFFNKNFGCGCSRPMQQMCCDQNDPIMEPPITKCIEKEFHHEVKHCCPIHTHVVNKHIYTHTYTPQFTCDEEDVVINNDCGSCSQFMNNNF